MGYRGAWHCGPLRLGGSLYRNSPWGHTFPGALVPWGMVSVSPHNDLKSPSGYTYGKPYIFGFGHVHLSGTGCPDLGNVLLMPPTGKLDVSIGDWGSLYNSETATPGYYAVNLKSYGILAEMTATLHAGISRYTFSTQKRGCQYSWMRATA